MSHRNRSTDFVRPRRPRLRVERLEDRAVPSISGVVWKDSLGGGTQNGGEVGLAGVGLTLWRDGGNGVFDNGGGDDVNLGSTTTLTDGTYLLTGVSGDGRYYVDINQTSTTAIAALALAVGTDPAVVNIVGGADATVNFGYRRQAPPPVTVAAGTQAPGAFPVRASGAIVNIGPVSGSVLGGTNSDSLKVTFVASGPFAWTESRHNEGDVSMSIGPAQPADPNSYPPNSFTNFAATASSPTTWAWRVNTEVGLSFASVHANGFDNGDVISGGTPVGPMFGVAYFNTDSSSGLGYDPVDGTQHSGGNASDLTMGLVGSPDEGSFNVAVAHFPFNEGWVGGYVSDQITQLGEAIFDQGMATPGLTPAVVTWTDPTFSLGRATVNLTGFRPDFTPTNGMLFVSPNAGDNNTNLIAALPNNTGGWDIALREDNNLDTSGNSFALQPDSEFQFMYVDFRYQGVIGARVNGSTGATIQGAGGYTLSKLATGTYALAIPGKTDTSGMLVLTVSGAQAGDPTLPSRAFLSYQFDQLNNRWVIQSRELTAGGNPFGEGASLVDTNFNFAWVDFANPMTPVIPPTTVAGVQVNTGGVQRSEVRSLQVTFSGPVTFANNNPTAAFQLTRLTGTGGNVGLTPQVSTNQLGQTVVTLTFNGQLTDPTSALNNGVPSLGDGRYQLTILDNTVFGPNGALDGDNNGTPGGAYVSPQDTANGGQGQLRLFRLFGDSTGNGVVDLADLQDFRSTFNLTSNQPGFLSYLDANNNGVVDLADLAEYRTRFNISVFP